MMRLLLRKDRSFIRASHMLAKTLAGTDRSDIPRYLLLFGVAPFPFQRGIIMTRFQSVGMIQCFHMSVKRGSSQLIMGLHLNLEALLLRRRFRELGYSSVFGLQFLIDEHQYRGKIFAETRYSMPGQE